MNDTIQPPEMSKVELGKIAVRILENLLSQGALHIETVKRILHATPACTEHITSFVASLIQRNDWFPSRSGELALTVVLECEKSSYENRLIIASAAAAVIEDTGEWNSFMSTHLQQIAKPQRINPKKARNDDWLESL